MTIVNIVGVASIYGADMEKSAEACSHPITEARQIHGLSEEQVSAMQRDGFLIVRNFFSMETMSEISCIADRLKETADGLGGSLSPGEEISKIDHKGTQFVLSRHTDSRVIIHRIVWAGAAEPRLIEFGRQPVLLEIVAQLLGAKEADHLINQIHYKLSGDGIRFGWHQDIKNRKSFDRYWDDVTGNGSFVQCIIAIDPMTEINGPLMYVPQSHLKGDLSLEMKNPDDPMFQGFEKSAIPLLMNPGDLLLMKEYLVHGSRPNESDRSRRIFLTGFSAPGANHGTYPGEGSTQRIPLDLL